MGLFLQKEAASDALNDALPALLPLGLVGVWRWGMWIFRVIGWFLYRVQSPRPDDKYKTTDVSLIVPTIDCDEEALTEAIRSWVLNEPFEILIITVESARDALQSIVDKSLGSGITRVIVSPIANKRVQLVVGIKESYGKLACFTDDDAIWNSYFLKYLLAPFNDPKMGGTGSNQIMRPFRMDVPPTTFERIGDMRLSSRMLEAAASTFYDGSVSCLSGRTALYHKRILMPLEHFESEFCNEYWLKAKLMSGDDKFMTRWVVKQGWKMRMQLSPECTLATTFKADGAFFKQILRWTRNTWRSDFKSLVLERVIWYRFPVQAVLMVDRMISPFTLTAGPVLFILALTYLSDFASWGDYAVAIAIYFLWILVSRTTRMLPHFYRIPEDLTYLPMFIAYQYFFAALKLYAAFTLNNTKWGTRDANAFKSAAEIAAEEAGGDIEAGSNSGSGLLEQSSMAVRAAREQERQALKEQQEQQARLDAEDKKARRAAAAREAQNSARSRSGRPLSGQQPASSPAVESRLPDARVRVRSNEPGSRRSGNGSQTMHNPLVRDTPPGSLRATPPGSLRAPTPPGSLRA